MKKKTSSSILINGIKDLHPMYQGYLIDRLKHDIEHIKDALPDIYEQDKIDTANGKISMFHPNFYVTYVNQVTDIIDAIDRNYHDNWKSDEPFTPTPKVPYFEN